ncbi:MAG: Flp pilus assembly complex ATPase component TadA [Planctomycetaceae bacterium]|jgi:type II secretory ATPase GspE/PulE/Tfp pilus assembly ATPase PilB-like protein|nr:Flp pilus assembly complex ATPase component TadA [Planctomycetaceae bacterium]
MSSLKKYIATIINCFISVKLPVIIAILAAIWFLFAINDIDNANKLNDGAKQITNDVNIVTKNHDSQNLSNNNSRQTQPEIIHVAARKRSTSLPVIKIVVRLARYLSGRNSGEGDNAGQAPTSEIKKELEEQHCLEDAISKGWRGAGWYMSPIKLALYIFLFFVWTFCASWMNGDMERQNDPKRTLKNTGYAALYVIVGTGVLFIPIFWVAFPITFLICFIPISVYVVKRNAKVPPHEQVLTPEHIKFVFAQWLQLIGVKIKVKKRIYETGPKIEFEASGKDIDKKTLTGRLVIARNAAGYNDFRQHVYDAIVNNATSMMFDFAADKTVIKHLIDGVWLELPPFPRTQEKNKTKDRFDEMLEAAKLLVGAAPENRRSKQEGSFIALVGSIYAKTKTKYDIKFTSQGTQTGEAVLLQFTAKKVPFKTIADLGIKPQTEQRIIEHLNNKQGLLIVAAPPANGLRSSIDVFSHVCDRFTRDVVNIEDAIAQSEEIENITMVRYDSSKGETPLDVLPNVLFKEPNAVYVRDMTALPTLELCCKDAANGRLFVTMIRAKDSIEAILKLLATKITPQTFLQPLNAVISQRLIRKLCPDCKEPYKPTPQLLQKLGLNPTQVQQLFTTRKPLPEPEERKRGICQTCNGVGYHGRTALLEIIELNDTIRGFIISNPNHDAIKQFLQKSGQRSFIHEGIELVVQGTTTVEELSRVLK